MKSRTPIIIGNWKMNLSINEAIRLVTELKSLISGKQDLEVVVAPNAVAVHSVCIALQDTQLKVAGQNMHWELSGAYTGEVAAPMLSEAGCTYVIVGHSERRRLMHETDREVQQKFHTALDHDLVPILCVGETSEQREKNQTLQVIEDQLRVVLQGSHIMSGTDFVVAYEPVWAIGTGKHATPEQIREVHGAIRNLISRLHRNETAESVRLVYGGSVTPENIVSIMGTEDVDGVLVGGASLDAKQFAAIVHYHETGEEEELEVRERDRKSIETEE